MGITFFSFLLLFFSIAVTCRFLFTPPSFFLFISISLSVKDNKKK